MKFWSFFAHPNPPESVIGDLVNVMVSNNFEIKPVLRALFNRAEFWGPTARQGLVRSPIEYVVHVLRQLDLKATTLQPLWLVESMGQEAFNPPNVSGWRQNRYWLSTSATSAKVEFASYIKWRMQSQHPFQPYTALGIPEAVNAAFDRLGLVDATPRSRQIVTQWLTVQRSTQYQGWAEVESFLKLMFVLPEMQLA